MARKKTKRQPEVDKVRTFWRHIERKVPAGSTLEEIVIHTVTTSKEGSRISRELFRPISYEGVTRRRRMRSRDRRFAELNRIFQKLVISGHLSRDIQGDSWRSKHAEHRFPTYWIRTSKDAPIPIE